MFHYEVNALQHEGVYVTDQVFNESQIDHVMEIAGWGETPSGMKYWVVRNSWGTYWGAAGWLKLRRGTNQMLSESECDWALPTFDDLDAALQGRVMGDYVQGIEQVVRKGASGGFVVAGPTESMVPLAQQAEQGGGIRWNSEMAFVLLSTFVSGIAAAVLAMRLVGGARFQQRPLL